MPEQETPTTEEPSTEGAMEEQVEEQEVVDGADGSNDAEVDDEDDAPENQDSAEYWRNKAKKNGNEAKNLRDRLKAANAELDPLKAAKLAQDRKGMNELQLAQSQVAELTETVERLTREGWQRDVDARWDLPARAKSFLTGTTAEEFMAAADDIAKDLGLERKDKSPRRTKTNAQDLGGGRNAGNEPAPTVDAQIAEATAAGDWNLVARLNVVKLATGKKK